jgi:hypothetical protein
MKKQISKRKEKKKWFNDRFDRFVTEIVKSDKPLIPFLFRNMPKSYKEAGYGMPMHTISQPQFNDCDNDA